MTGSPLTAGPVETIAAAIDRLSEIKERVGEKDRLYEFTNLYEIVTTGVDEAIRKGVLFKDEKYLTELDVVFANRYFAALAAFHTPGSEDRAPAAWRPLFGANPDAASPRPFQLAIAGVNAHIAFDLPIAVVDTCDRLGRTSLDAGAERADYEAVNQIFKERMREILAEIDLPGPKCQFLEALGVGVADLARDEAWRDAERLWAIRRDPTERPAAEKALDDHAAALTRVLVLDPADPWGPL